MLNAFVFLYIFTGTLNRSDFKKCLVDLNVSLNSTEMNQVISKFSGTDNNDNINYIEFLREISPSLRKYSKIQNQNTTYKAADRLRTMIKQRAKDMSGSSNGNLRGKYSKRRCEQM